jgi:endogenous inhibitor of DNA gyrase (YacG/DUF329 family)
MRDDIPAIGQKMRLPKNNEKQIVQKIKKSKHWHHDIEYIDGEFVEVVVMRYQKTGDESLLAKITGNYEIYRGLWAKEFCKYLDKEVEAGEAMHDEIIWNASIKFNRNKTVKRDGKAFNAYYVSACLNQLKNFRNAMMSHKNHPRIKCPICGEEVFQIDAAHLRHHYDLDRYRRDFPNHPFSSLDGMVVCPIIGERLVEITESYLNRIEWPDKSKGYYTLLDFEAEYGSTVPKGPFTCPVTGLRLNTMSNYPGGIASGYSATKFIDDFKDFKAIFQCPFTGKKMLEMTQEHLDIVLDQVPCPRKTIADLLALFPNVTTKAKQAMVENPYTGQMVPEITLSDLVSAKTTVQEHLGKYMKHALDKWYPVQFKNPFTGKNTKQFKRESLKKLKKTSYDFFLATSQYPLKKWQVKCAICGDWVDNVWTHLESPSHSYSKNTTTEEFAMSFQGYPTKATISTNSFYESDSGDSVHISDLLSKKTKSVEPLDIEDSLLSVATDEVDKRIAGCIKNCRTIDDVFHMSAVKKKIKLKGKNVNTRDAIAEILGDDDFDLANHSGGEVEIMIPCRDTIKKRLVRLYQSSDLAQEISP